MCWQPMITIKAVPIMNLQSCDRFMTEGAF